MGLVHHLNEVANNQRNGLDSLQFLFGSDLLSSQFLLVLFNELLLNSEDLKVLLELLESSMLILDLNFCLVCGREGFEWD